MLQTKICRFCEQEKEIHEFHLHVTTKDGIRNECKVCRKIKDKESYNYDRQRESNLLTKYGITIKDYNDMFVQQQGCCTICGRHQSELNNALGVDHCHKTKKVRSLLCRGCNSRLGTYENGKEAFEKYLKQYGYDSFQKTKAN